MRRASLLAIAVLLSAAPLVAQEAQQQLERPEGWKVRFDRAEMTEADLETFVSMPPGWHITTGRAAGIFYEPARTAAGRFTLRATIHLFDPGRRHREAYGVFFGGTELEGDGQRYSYFLIRDTGEFLVKRRSGSETETVVPWTASDAVVRFTGEETATNELAVECGAEEVHFYVNDEKVISVPRAALDTEGIVGLRVNHALNLHVSELEVAAAGHRETVGEGREAAMRAVTRRRHAVR